MFRWHQKTLEKVLAACGVTLLLAIVIFPISPIKPFHGYCISMWIISALAQDLIFIGYFHGQLEQFFPTNTHSTIPFTPALMISGLLFSAWHIPNLMADVAISFLIFQLVYTFVIFIVIGLSRQWAGRIIYYSMTNTSLNFVAWYFSQYFSIIFSYSQAGNHKSTDQLKLSEYLSESHVKSCQVFIDCKIFS